MLNNTTVPERMLENLTDPLPGSKSSSGNQMCSLLNQVRKRDDIALASFQAACVFLSCINAILAVTSIVFNVVILAAFARSETLRTPSNLLLLGLSCCDFFVGLVTQPLLTAEIALFAVNANAACTLKDFYVIFLFSFSSSSLVHICLTCADRFVAILLPFKHQRLVTKKRVVKGMVAFWIAWVLLTVFTRREHGGGVIGYSRIAFVVFSAFIVVSINLRLWIEAQRHLRQIQNCSLPIEEETHSHTRAAARARETKATKTILSIIGLVVLCNLPLVATFIVRKFFGARGRLATLFWLASNTIALFPASLNPVAYVWRKRDIRDAVRRIRPGNRVGLQLK